MGIASSRAPPRRRREIWLIRTSFEADDGAAKRGARSRAKSWTGHAGRAWLKRFFPLSLCWRCLDLTKQHQKSIVESISKAQSLIGGWLVVVVGRGLANTQCLWRSGRVEIADISAFVVGKPVIGDVLPNSVIAASLYFTGGPSMALKRAVGP